MRRSISSFKRCCTTHSLLFLLQLLVRDKLLSGVFQKDTENNGYLWHDFLGIFLALGYKRQTQATCYLLQRPFHLNSLEGMGHFPKVAAGSLFYNRSVRKVVYQQFLLSASTSSLLKLLESIQRDLDRPSIPFFEFLYQEASTQYLEKSETIS